MGPHPAVAAIRLAVRRVLHDVLHETQHQHAFPHDAFEEGAFPPGAFGGADAYRETGSPVRDARHAGVPGGGVRADTPQTGVDRASAARARSGTRGARRGRPEVPEANARWCWSPAAAAPTRWPWPARAAFVAPRLGLRVGAVTVDHGLQDGSPHRARDGRRAQLRRSRPRSGRGGRGRRSAAPAAPRRPPATPATPRSTTSPSASARAACCSATPATTRPRPCCSGWPAAPAPARWPACPRSSDPAAATGARCWPGPRPPPRRLRGRRASSRGTTRTTPTRLHQVPGAARGCCRSWRSPRAGHAGGAGPHGAAAARGRRGARRMGRPGVTAGRCRATSEAASTRPAGRAAHRGAPPGAEAAPAAARRAPRPARSLAAPHRGASTALITDWRGQGPLDLPGAVVEVRRTDGRLAFGETASAPSRRGRRHGQRPAAHRRGVQ